MPTQLDLLTPPSHSPYAALAAEYAADYAAAFASAGLRLTSRDWTSAEAGRAPAVALLAWGYYFEAERWAALLDGWPADNPLFNAPALMRWNMRKTYLIELEAAGVPTVPTWFGNASPETIAAAFGCFGADELIVKPQVSAGSHDTHRLKRGDDLPSVRDAMVQPFLPAIKSEGEYSLFYIGGAFSHAVRKVAADGEFRIQPQFGGIISRWTPDAEALEVAETSLRTTPDAPLYARIDLLRRRDERLALIEFEAIEPDLYDDYGDGVLERLAVTVRKML